MANPRMTDPKDRDIHGEDDSAYPESPQGRESLYTDGGDTDDAEAHAGGEKSLRQMSAEEYEAWKKGRAQNKG